MKGPQCFTEGEPGNSTQVQPRMEAWGFPSLHKYHNRKVKNRQAKWVEEFKTFPPLSGSELWVLRPVRLRMNQNPHKTAGEEKN